MQPSKNTEKYLKVHIIATRHIHLSVSLPCVRTLVMLLWPFTPSACSVTTTPLHLTARRTCVPEIGLPPPRVACGWQRLLGEARQKPRHQAYYSAVVSLGSPFAPALVSSPASPTEVVALLAGARVTSCFWFSFLPTLKQSQVSLQSFTFLHVWHFLI